MAQKLNKLTQLSGFINCLSTSRYPRTLTLGGDFHLSINHAPGGGGKGEV